MNDPCFGGNNLEGMVSTHVNNTFEHYQRVSHCTSGPYEVAIAMMLDRADVHFENDDELTNTLSMFYVTLGLAGEAGEVAGKVKKILRDNSGEISDEVRRKLAKELGDILWYVAELCTFLDLDMGDVATGNITKLKNRQERGTLQGDGDER